MANKQDKVTIIDKDWRGKAIMSLPGNTPGLGGLAGGNFAGQTLPQPDVPAVRGRLEVIQPPDLNRVAMYKRGALSGWGEPPNFSTVLDVAKIQNAIRTAERGDTWQLFTIFRDMEAGYTHLQSEFAKRRLTVVGQPHTILPLRKNNKDDEKACEVLNEMIMHCENWDLGIEHLLSATLWPLAVVEKLFSPVTGSEKGDYQYPVKFRLRKLDPVSPTLFCFKIPYLASAFGAFSDPNLSPQNLPIGPESAYWNPDDWEPELTFYEVFSNGYPNLSPANTYRPDPARHLVHRGTNLSRTIRDNFGGHMRAIMFWWFLATQGRDWFGRYMQRWGHPFLLGKVDAQQKDTLAFMQGALSLSTEIGGLIIDKNAEAELLQAASLNGSEGYKLFLEVCNDEVSKIVVGQTLSSSARSTGLGSGVARLHGEVRQDYRQSDMRKLSNTLLKQLFNHYLRINGYTGKVKGIIWGGKDEQQAELLGRTIKDLRDAQLQPTDDALEVISERFGFGIERAPEPVEPQGSASAGGVIRRGGRSRPSRANARNFSADSNYEDIIREHEENSRKQQDTIDALQQEMFQIKNLARKNGKSLNAHSARI